jgi:hypothetical protein
MDTFTVSSAGQYVTSPSGLLIGAMDRVTALQAAVQTFPTRQNKHKSQNIGPGADLVMTIHADNSMVRARIG